MKPIWTRSPGCCGARRVALAASALAAVLVPCAAGDGLPQLKVSGRFLVDASGAQVTLRGCNLGSWLLIEPWMLGIRDPQLRDQYSLVNVLESRFGPQRAAQLIELYRENWITPRELALAKSFGFNVVRVPFHYGLLVSDERPAVLRAGAFKWLDRAVDLAEQAGMYVILDLHGAPGGQSIDGTTGRAAINEMWDKPANRELTAWLWRQIAERYRDRSAVAAYDLINEPWGDFREDVRPRLLDIVSRLYAAVRAEDPDKLIFAPGALRGIAFYGDPQTHGWKNVGFTEHFYPGLFGQGAVALETHARFLSFALAARRQLLEQLDVPYLLGEFNVVFDRVARPEMMRRYFDACRDNGWQATMWSLRMISPQGGVRPDHWYLVTNAEPFALPDLNAASYEEIERAFGQLGALPLVTDEPLRAALTATQSNGLPLATFPTAALCAPPHDDVPGWTGADVGATPAGGAKVWPDGAVTVYGGGGDVWDRSDEFRYLYRPTTSDFAVQGQLTALSNSHPLTKAGWMLRASLAPDAAHVLVHAFADGRIMLAWRAQRGGLTREQTLAISDLPIGLGLERSGGTVQVRYTDADGNWHRQPVPEEVRLPDSALLGLFVVSHDNAVLAAATFAGVGTTDASPLRRAAEGTNLLQNASFEVVPDADSAADRAQHWERWGDWLNREQDWTPRRDGHCVLGYHHWQIESTANSGVYQDVAGLKPGTRCTFSVYANRDLPADGKHGPDTVEVRIESRYDGRLLTVASQTYTTKDLASGDGWSRLAVTGTLPADNARVLIVANPSPELPRDAAVKFDLACLCIVQKSDAIRTASHMRSSRKEEKND